MMKRIEDVSSVGFIGLGAMGLPMTEQLAQKLPPTTAIHVFDVVESSIQTLLSKASSQRIKPCKNSKEVAENSDIILVMVPEGSHSRQVFLDEQTGILAHDAARKILIDCSTIDTESSKVIAEQVAQRHSSASFYDAPVSGGVTGASAGTLTFMVGATEQDPNWQLLNVLLGLMGKSVFACGGPTTGLTSKLCNNYLSGLVAIAVSESMNIGIRSGLDPRRLAAVFSTSTAQTAILDKFSPVPDLLPNAPSSKGYQGGFKVQLMRKDFALAVQTAERVGANLRLGSSGLDVYTETMNDERCRDLDSRVVYRYLGGVEDWKSHLHLQEGEEGDEKGKK